MVVTVKHVRRPAPGDGRDGDTGGVRADGHSYTPEDAENFDRIAATLPRTGDVYRIRMSQNVVSPVASVFEYSTEDTNQFEDLMAAFPNMQGGRRGRTASQRKPGQGFGYTDADDRLFSEFMEQNRYRSATATESFGEGDPMEIVGGAFTYTNDDEHAFRRMVPGAETSGIGEKGEARDSSIRTDRDVGPIRIVDTDREKLRERQTRRSGAVNMKIRFFD